jgi:hypothetical protein
VLKLIGNPVFCFARMSLQGALEERLGVRQLAAALNMSI